MEPPSDRATPPPPRPPPAEEVVVVRRLGRGPSALLPLTKSFADLSSETEFRSYGDAEWRFLLGGDDVTGYAIFSSSDDDDEDDDNGRGDHDHRRPRRLDGCVLKVRVNDDDDDGTVGFGMVLVRPSRRGRGYARALLREAMGPARGENNNGDDEGGRSVLAVCSPMGQPLYRKLGFADAGTVTAVTCSVSDLLRMPPRGSLERDGEPAASWTARDGGSCAGDRRFLDALVERDARAGGFRRRDRWERLLRGGGSGGGGGSDDGARATVAWGGGSGDLLLPDDAAADGGGASIVGVARQDRPGGPLIVGPVMGRRYDRFVPLLRTLVKKHFERTEEGDDDAALDDDVVVTTMIAGDDHPGLVTALLRIDGMRRAWECPAMSSDGTPVRRDGDGSYLALLHPTLG